MSRSRISIATRREFLARGLGLVGVGAVLPNFLIQTACAGPEAEKDQRILVVLEMGGGHDGPSAVVPYAMDGYQKLRQNTRIPTEDVLKLDDEVGLHPNLKGFKELLDQRAFAVVQGVGYPNPNYSHFEAMDIYSVADPKGKKAFLGGDKKDVGLGWLGRYVDQNFKGNNDPLLTLAIGGGVAPVAISGKEHPGLCFHKPENFRFQGDRGDPRRADLHKKLNGPAEEAAGARDMQFVTQTAINANSSSEKVREVAGKYKTDVVYPQSGLGHSLRTVAALIAGGLSTRVFYVRQGGYDTHAEQKPNHDRLMADLNNAMQAFHKDLTAQKNAARVLTMTFSEFGRRPEENASRGTDHGSAGPMFLFGPAVKPGVHGKHPSYEKFNKHKNFEHGTDFRNVYAAVLEKWLKVPSQPILGEAFQPTDCIA